MIQTPPEARLNPRIPSPQPAHPRARWQPAIAVLLSCTAVVLVFYLWLVSVGSWDQWPSISHTYNQLASAFLRGHLWLSQKPDPALLALPDPYDPSARKGVPFPLDASLYKGRFYLYFGPVPGLLLAAAKLSIKGRLGDEYLVFVFVAGLFLVQAAFAYRIRQRFYADVSLLNLGGSVLVLGLAAPAGWLLSTPTVYEAAITGGAFFLAAGMFAAFEAVDDGNSSWAWLVFAGVCWAAAVGSRFTQALPVVLLTILTAGEIHAQHRRSTGPGSSIRRLVALLVPLLLGASALGWYNWRRFDSVLEFGIRYQLSGGFQQHWGHLFSPLNIIQNAANYLLAPPRFGYAFPYLKPTFGFRESVIPGLPLPDIYWSSPMTGLLMTSPFIIFSVAAAYQAIRLARVNQSAGQDGRSLRWLMFALWIAFVSNCAIFLTFFWSAERYMADFAPALFLLSLIGYWQLGRTLSARPLPRAMHLSLGMALAVVTILISNLLAIAPNATGFRALNPALWRQLGNLFRP